MTSNRANGPGRNFGARCSATRAAIFLLGCGIVGCSGSDDPVVPPSIPPRDPPRAGAITVSPTVASLSYVGETVTFRATVTDQYGASFSGSVAWASGAPQVFAVDANGVVTAVANGSGTVTASVQGVSGSASVMVEQLPSGIAVVAGDNQLGRPGRPLTKPLIVVVADAGGAPVADVDVGFAPAEGSGQVSRPTAATDAAGEAVTLWTLGDGFGAQTVTATIAGGASAVLTATALRPEALVDSIAVVSGDGQATRVATALREAIVVRVIDEGGRPVDGVPVHFQLPEGHGRTAPDSVATDGAGLASTTWTLGNKKGLQLLTATVPGRASVRLTATGLFGAALELVSGDRQSADVGTELSKPVVLRVRDQTGELLEGVSVRFMTNRGHGTVSPDSVVSDASGEAATTWTLGGTAGIQTLTAAVAGGDARAVLTARAKSGLGVCDRTPQIRDAIMARLGSNDCANVTEDQLGWITSLNLQGAQITSLYEDDFAGLHDLISLLLDSNEIRVLPTGVFTDLMSLHLLWLDDNRLTALPDHVFAGLTNLEELSLRGNRLDTLDSPIAHLPALERLYLDDNPFRGLPPRPFSRLPELRELTLGGYEMRSIPQDMFAGLAQLDLLYLQDTGLSEFPSGLFSNLSSLRALWLQGNYQLSRFRPGDFAGLANLEDLLIGSVVTELPPQLLAGLSNLRRLSLSGRFTEVPEDFFADVTALEDLWLGGRGPGIATVPNAIRHLTELRELSLRHVDLGNVGSGAFSGLTKLERLRLAWGEDALPGELPTGLFQGLSSLWELYIYSHPSLELSPGFLHGLASLQQLRLNGQGIARLPEKVFSTTPELRVLHVIRTNVSELPHGVFSGLHGLEELYLSLNPGTPFPISLSMERADTTDLAAPGPATIVVRVAEGAPFDMEIDLSASGGTLSVASVTIAAGATESAPIIVTASGQGVTTVEFGAVPELPDSLCPKRDPGRRPSYPCYDGISVQKGDTIRLFR